MTEEGNWLFTGRKAAESGQVQGAGGAPGCRAVGANLGKRPLEEGHLAGSLPLPCGAGPLLPLVFTLTTNCLLGFLIPAEAEARPVK